ncbi:hypothetical protein [Rhodococcoides fascians]|uniref:hypothetical protein n=1 Tax=Rhodococcoides fascians TaxID=1828 RepID=UPI0005620101|nr:MULTISPECIES: hypothetical protein [Rhodococcus]OZE97441.1 hypothetical protein CH301_17915 [Rhodococcus sp. 15-1189-1-1a]OZF12135.1 hypothetical protein CH299_18610 [Rhodococcus sp. 14-2686-1-2]
MPDHDVRLSTRNLEVKGINLEFEVKIDRSKLGTLAISEGSLEWTPRSGRTPISITWLQFAKWAES